MEELLNVLKDIKSRALPISEIPSFIVWLLGKPCVLVWLATVAIAVVLWIVKYFL